MTWGYIWLPFFRLSDDDMGKKEKKYWAEKKLCGSDVRNLFCRKDGGCGFPFIGEKSITMQRILWILWKLENLFVLSEIELNKSVEMETHEWLCKLVELKFCSRPINTPPIGFTFPESSVKWYFEEGIRTGRGGVTPFRYLLSIF